MRVGQVTPDFVERRPLPGAGQVLAGHDEGPPVHLEDPRRTVQALLQAPAAVEVLEEAEPRAVLDADRRLTVLEQPLVVQAHQRHRHLAVLAEEVQLGLAGHLRRSVQDAAQLSEGLPPIERTRSTPPPDLRRRSRWRRAPDRRRTSAGPRSARTRTASACSSAPPGPGRRRCCPGAWCEVARTVWVSASRSRMGNPATRGMAPSRSSPFHSKSLGSRIPRHRVARRRGHVTGQRPGVGQRVEPEDPDLRRSSLGLPRPAGAEGEQHLAGREQMELHVLGVLVSVLVDNGDVPDEAAGVGRALRRRDRHRGEHLGRGGGEGSGARLGARRGSRSRGPARRQGGGDGDQEQQAGNSGEVLARPFETSCDVNSELGARTAPPSSPSPDWRVNQES